MKILTTMAGCLFDDVYLEFCKKQCTAPFMARNRRRHVSFCHAGAKVGCFHRGGGVVKAQFLDKRAWPDNDKMGRA